MSPMPRTLEPEVMDTPEEALAYEAMDHAEPNRAFVQRLVELGAKGTMLDIGTGPGHLPVLVCETIPGSRVFGVDLSGNMLKLAEQRRRRSKVGNRIIFEKADAKGLNYQERNFDVVFSNTILHHIPDPRPFLREARRVLRPRGVLLIRDLMRPESPERALELVRLHAAGATPEQQELFRASLHAALTPQELRAVADESGLSEAVIVIDSDRHMSLQLLAG